MKKRYILLLILVLYFGYRLILYSGNNKTDIGESKHASILYEYGESYTVTDFEFSLLKFLMNGKPIYNECPACCYTGVQIHFENGENFYVGGACCRSVTIEDGRCIDMPFYQWLIMVVILGNYGISV